MKNLYAASLGALVMAAVLLVAGCSGPLNQLKTTNPGNVRLSLAGQYARTLSPAAPVSLSYKVEFTNSGTSGAVKETIPDWDGAEALEFDLAYGTWAITVTGIITEDEAEMEISRGSANLTISEEQPEGTVTVTMLPLLGSDGAGTLSYSTGTGGIDWTEAGSITSATLSVTPLAGGVGETKNLLSQQSGGISLAPGYYIVTVSLTSGISVASKTEVAHIYKDQTTETGATAFVFTAEDFSRAINYADEGIYVGIIKFGDVVTDLTGTGLVLLNASGKDTLINLLNTNYVLSSSPGTTLFYGVHKALANLKSAETTYPANLESVNIVTFTDGLDISSAAQSMENPVEEGVYYPNAARYAEYIAGEIANRSIATKPITAYSVGVRGDDVNDDNLPVFESNLESIASPGNKKPLGNFGELQQTFNEIAESLNIEHRTTSFILKTATLDDETGVRMTFDPISDNLSESERYIEGTFRISGMGANITYTLHDITYGGGVDSSVGTGPLTGTKTGSEVSFLFSPITGYNSTVDTSNTKQWIRSTPTSSWRINSEYSQDGSNSSTVEKLSSVIYLVLDSSTSLHPQDGTDYLPAIQTASISFINSLYTKYNDSSGGSQQTPTTVLVPGAWANGSITTSGQTKQYSFNVTSGTTYSIWWNDLGAGNQTKTLDIQVSAKYSGASDNIFSNVDSAWSTPQTFTPTANGQVIVTVQAGYYYNYGDYAITYNWSGVNPSVPVPSLTGTVSISGTAHEGETLTASTSSLGGSGTISYQWNRRTTETGTDTPIAGATESTYIPVADDTGKYITVTVTRAGFAGSLTSIATAAVTEQPTPTPTTLSWSGNWIAYNTNAYYSNSIGNGGSTWQTLTITSNAGCSITVTLTASSEGNYDWGYASTLDGSASTSSYQFRVSGSSSNSQTYTIPAGTHVIRFGYVKDSTASGGNDRVTVSVTVN